MQRFQNGSILRAKRKSGPDAWVFRWYDESRGKRTYRKRVIGTVDRMPLRRDAERAVLQHRVNINSGIVTPEMVIDLINHYKAHELTEERKAFATVEGHDNLPRAPYKAALGRDTPVLCPNCGGRTMAVLSQACSGNAKQDPKHHVGTIQPRTAA